jgi:hypothetical protein
MRWKSSIFVIVLILLIFVFPLVLAVKTPILIHSHPNHTISINIIEPKTEDSLEHFVGNSGKSGIFAKDTSVTQEFKVVLLASKNKKFAVPPTSFGNYTPGETLEFLLTKTEVKEISDQEPKETEEKKDNKSSSENATLQTESVPEQKAEETEKNQLQREEKQEETENKSLTGITGKAVSETNNDSELKDILIKVGSIIFLAVFALFTVFLTLKTISKRKTKIQEKGGNIKLTKYQDFKDKMQKNRKVDKKLSEAEKRLKQAQQEVDRLKRIKEIESELNKREKELNKLKGKE